MVHKREAEKKIDVQKEEKGEKEDNRRKEREAGMKKKEEGSKDRIEKIMQQRTRKVRNGTEWTDNCTCCPPLVWCSVLPVRPG
jgi:hypothetical protein